MRGGAGGFGRTAGFEDEEIAERGRDIEGDILVTLEEAMRGSVRSVNVRRPAGRSVKTETYQVKIPPGVTEGQKLRVAGRGEAGSSGGEAGDLYLRVRLARHPDFEVEDHNLIYEAELAPWEAVLGANLSVPALDGRVNIKIPPGTQNGQKLRVRARGLPTRDGGAGRFDGRHKNRRAGQSHGRGEKIVGAARARVTVQSENLKSEARVPRVLINLSLKFRDQHSSSLRKGSFASKPKTGSYHRCFARPRSRDGGGIHPARPYRARLRSHGKGNRTIAKTVRRAPRLRRR